MAATSIQTVFDFHKSADISSWRIEDDRVMGGISQGIFELNDDGHAHFHGIVTSESNGGFSSVQNNNYDLKVTPNDKIRITLKGDGHEYRFRIKDQSSSYYSYQKSFKTTGEWQEIEIQLSDMTPTFRGRKVNLPNYDQKHISQIRFLIGTKKVQESFDLLIDKIELIKA
ncbi:CIA30 family protein [Nonlabens sp.]|mgnify:FL=1|uniref:CIA30 family protein n=1 Tax=Nonlabens sp. TaxID=1888209 RepID=UPI003F6A01C5